MNERRTGGGPIDHPDHYQVAQFVVTEVQDVIEGFNLNFSQGNVLKYLLRAGAKGDELGDLQKAKWYLNRVINHAACRMIDADREKLRRRRSK